MKEWIDFLSGEVPGGIGLYLMIVGILFFTLYAISRTSEVFTPRHFRKWFGISWLLITGLYGFVWLQNPPPRTLSPYMVIVSGEDDRDRWMVSYLREVVEANVQPFRSQSEYLYPPRWEVYAHLECSEGKTRQCREFAAKLPVRRLVTVSLRRRGDEYALVFSENFPSHSGQKGAERELVFAGKDFPRAVHQFLNWLKDRFPLHNALRLPEPVDQDFFLAIAAFRQKDYSRAADLLKKVLRRFPENPEVRRWYFYNQIRRAALARAREPKRNPFDYRKREWERWLDEARAFLIPLAQQLLQADGEDWMLLNMIGESFILTEEFADAEHFLKLAFHQNPFSIEVLENLSLLHESRYAELPYHSRLEIYERILQICPVHEPTLRRYVEKQLIDLPVDQTPSEKINFYLQRALSLNPTSVEALILQGKYYLAIFDYPGALDNFLAADSLEPDNPVLKYNLGVTYFRLKRMEQAEAYFRRAVELGDYLDAHLYLGVIYQEQGDCDRALREFRYRVAHKEGEDDYYAIQAMKGIRKCLEMQNKAVPQSGGTTP